MDGQATSARSKESPHHLRSLAEICQDSCPSRLGEPSKHLPGGCSLHPRPLRSPAVPSRPHPGHAHTTWITSLVTSLAFIGIFPRKACLTAFDQEASLNCCARQRPWTGISAPPSPPQSLCRRMFTQKPEPSPEGAGQAGPWKRPQSGGPWDSRSPELLLSTLGGRGGWV